MIYSLDSICCLPSVKPQHLPELHSPALDAGNTLSGPPDRLYHHSETPVPVKFEVNILWLEHPLESYNIYIYIYIYIYTDLCERLNCLAVLSLLCERLSFGKVDGIGAANLFSFLHV